MDKRLKAVEALHKIYYAGKRAVIWLYHIDWSRAFAFVLFVLLVLTVTSRLFTPEAVAPECGPGYVWVNFSGGSGACIEGFRPTAIP